MSLAWNCTNDYLHGISKEFNFTDKIAMFDLDNTLTITKSGKKFPIDENDWKWMYPNIPNKLEELFFDNYAILIVSNQAGIAKTMDKENK